MLQLDSIVINCQIDFENYIYVFIHMHDQSTASAVTTITKGFFWSALITSLNFSEKKEKYAFT